MLLYVVGSLPKFLVIGLSIVLFQTSHGALVATSMPNVASVTQAPVVKSYREWKANMIHEAEQRVKNTRDSFFKIRKTSSESNQNGNTQTEAGMNTNLLDLLDKEQLQLSLVKDLTISDYFVGYLTKQKQLSQAIKEVSGRLSAEEVAELMTAYANNFFSTKPTPTTSAPRADSGQ